MPGAWVKDRETVDWFLLLHGDEERTVFAVESEGIGLHALHPVFEPHLPAARSPPCSPSGVTVVIAA